MHQLCRFLGCYLCVVHQKVEKKLPTWQSATLSMGGKLVLIEACLSAIPNYTMGVYLLPEESHHKMDTIRSNFFWHGPSLKKEISHGELGPFDEAKVHKP